MNKLRLIEVPLKSKDHFINMVGCLRFVETKGTVEVSSCIEPQQIGFYLENELHKIVGYVELDDKKYIAIENRDIPREKS